MGYKRTIYFFIATIVLLLGSNMDAVAQGCDCAWIKIRSQDTISDDAYINYSFTVKNRCKEPIVVNSKKFGFVVNNFNGTRAKVIRTLDFNMRFTYPEFVVVKPGENFEFKFADNPFDEYALQRGYRYWFRFSYNNVNNKKSTGKGINYVCKKELQRMVYIK